MKSQYQWLKRGLPLLLAMAPGALLASSRSVSSGSRGQQPIVLALAENMESLSLGEESFSAFGAASVDTASAPIIDVPRPQARLKSLNQKDLALLLNKNSSSGEAGGRFNGVKVVGDVNELIMTVGTCITSSTGLPYPGNGWPGICSDNLNQSCDEDSDCTKTLSVADASRAEGDSGSANNAHTVTLSSASALTVTVAYATSNGTATAGSDYTSTSGTLTFAVGETSKTINVPVLGDGLIEPNETYTLALSAPTGEAAIGDGSATGTIVNDDLAPVVSSVTSSTANGTYKVGDAVAVTVNFSKAVIVTGTPQLTLETGTTDAVLNYASGSGTTALTFNYTVTTGHSSPDLDYASTSALALNSGTIRDAATNDATLTLASPGAANSLGANKNLVIDGIAPTVSSVSVPANATYSSGQNLDFTVNTSENVTVNTGGGTPRIALTIGATTRYASYVSGSGTSALLFRYAVDISDGDSDGIAVAGSLDLNSGTIQDAAGNAITTTLNAVGSTTAVLVLNGPTVTDGNISISGASGTGGAYKIGDTVTATWNNTGAGDNNAGITGVTVDFSQFGGGSAVAATENSGIWTATYTITAGAVDATNRNVSVTASNAQSPTTTADTTNATVDSVAPTVSNANISISGGTGTGGAYKIGDTVTATWNNTAGGDNNSDTIASATVNFSAFGGGAAVAATNSSGTWTATYTITAGAIDATNRNISFTATDNAGNTTNAADSSNATVDSQAPTVTDGNISISGGSGGGGGFIIGDTVTATWNNTVGGDNNGDTISTVTVDFTGFGGGAAVAATNSAQIWTATYTIVSGVIDSSNRNVAVTATDNAGNTTTTVDTSNASVDNIAPTVSSVSVPANAAYIAGQNLDFTVNNSQNITVNTTGGTPRIALTLGASTVYASYLSGSGSSALTFRYTLQAGDLDVDGIVLAGVIDLNGGTLKDGSGNDLNLTLNSVGSTAAVLVDAVVPNAPSAPDLADLSDSGNNTDNITNDTTPTLTGTAEADSTVTLYDTDGTTVLGAVTATGGNWSITSTTLSEGSHSLTAKATDGAGNQSDASGALNITIDATAHTKPTAPMLATASDTGASNADSITNLTTLTLQGAAGSVEAFASVHARSNLEGGLTNTTANADGSWTLVVSGMSEGTHELTIRATDVAGNQSVYSDPLSVVIDTTVPTVTSVAFDQANVTVANRTAISLSLAGAETGTKASYSITSNNGGTAVTASDLAVSSAAQQFTGIDVTGLNDGTLTVSLTLVDLAGNTSTAVTNTISKDANVPEVTSVAITSGNYAEGDVIGVTINLNEDVTVSGTNSALAIDIGGVTRQAVFVSENAGVLTYQYTVQANDNTSGTGVIALANGLSLNGDTILDAGNNPASLVYAQASNVNAQVDTTAPVGVVVASPATAVSVNADDYTINGTHVENGVTITLYLDADNDGVADNGLVLDSVVVTGGAWSLSAPLTADSANNFVIVVEDAAGNLSAAVDVPTITEDSISPAAPAAADLLAASDTGASDSDGVTSNTTPTLTGTAEPNSTVTLTSDLDGVVGTAVADGAGDWSITASTLSPGVHSLTTTATDAADNVSTLSAALSITVDNQAPTLSAIANQSLNPGASSSALAVTLADDASTPANLTFTATSSNVAVVPLANLVLGGADADRTITVTALGSGTSTITLSVEDEAGNTGTGTFTVSVNGAPTISGTPTTSINQGAPYSFIPTAVDGDGDGLTFSINTTPAWASFNPATGALTGTPTNADVGTTSGIVISVSDGTLSTSLSAFDLTVVNINDAPLISGTPTTSVDQDIAYSFTPTASDVDVGDVLTYSITNKPTWAAFDTATGALTGTPVHDDVGTTTGIVITVSDGVLSASLPAFNLEVIETIDPLQPVVTAPEDIAINATGLYTPVSLRQLLSLNASATQEQVDAILNSMASDGVSGNTCCTTNPEGLNVNNVLLLPPGRHEVSWSATNGADVTGTATQVVDIRPLVSLSKSQIAIRGSAVEFRVLLNGKAPEYPVAIPYVIDAATTAGTTEHNLVNGVANFTEAGQLEVIVPVQLATLSGLSDSELVVRLDGDINAGVANSHTIRIREGNIAPMVSLQLTQGGVNTIQITPAGGPVTLTATVTDLNPGDTHSYNWSASDTALGDTDGNPVNNTLVFDPSNLSGRHQAQVTVTDTGGATANVQLYFRVVPSLPVLVPDADTDGDGVTDTNEGFGDTNGNGIPDYLDNMPTSNILPQQGAITNAYLIECDPGVRCGLGQFALVGESGGVQILNEELGTTGELIIDPTFEPVGGIFDFVINDLPTLGQSVRIVIPQVAPIPANAVYRKYQDGRWVNFISNANNSIFSAPGNPGYCPPPGNPDWTPGLTAGNLCVQLTIEDGGPNDDDGLINAAIVDPGAVSVALPVEPPPPPPPAPDVNLKSKGGGAIDGLWLLLLGSVLMMKWITGTNRRGLIALALIATSASSQALTDGKAYVRVDVYKVEGDQREATFTQALSAAGHEFTVDKYDIDRRGYQIAFGYQWHDYTYSELGYLELGDVTVDMTLDGDTDLTAFKRDFANAYPVSASGWTAVQGLTLLRDQPVNISLEAGAYFWQDEKETNQQPITLQSDSGVAPLAGIRLDLGLTKNLSYGLSVRRIYLADQVVDMYSLSGRLRF